MKRANYAFVMAIVFAMSSGSAFAEEQTVPSKSTPQPTVMSDAQLDQIVGGNHINTITGVLGEHEVYGKGPDDGTVQDALNFALSQIPGHE